ncbi:MAG TPA: type I-B CRISPR-associated endonuclease Cas1b [Dehalococcoidia bacterium]|nr:type I-B CRISPR-associated endonuclease Cas1b [Dehalococcoidia bacterium]
MARSYYLFRSGRLRRHQNTLYLEGAGDGERRPIPIEDVRDLYLFGEIDLNTKLLNFLGRHGVLLHCFNYYGFYTGTFYPRESNVSGHLLVRQVEHYLDPAKRLYLAGQFVDGALFHLRRNLAYYKRRGRQVDDAIACIDRSLAELTSCPDVPSLMGLEGRARDAYYAAFNSIMDLEEPFQQRVRRPPDNLINALLSFGNTLLYTAVLAEIYVTQLNPTISYLHEPSQRRFSLALDLAEVFRPLIVDRTIFRVINRNMVDEGDLEPLGKSRGVYLSERGRKTFIRALEETLATTVHHRALKRNVSYRQLLRLEAYKLVRHLIDMEPYRPLRAWW